VVVRPGGTRLRFQALAGLGLGTILAASPVLPYNASLTGDPLKFPVNAYFDRYHGAHSNDYGFGADRGMGWDIDPNPGHSPVDGLINANLNAFGLNTDLFGWGTGSLIFVMGWLCAGTFSRSDRLMIASTAAFVGAYFFYYFSGGPTSGRATGSIIVPLVALTARGIAASNARRGRAPAWPWRPSWR
jgi:hypothetical protein